MTAGTIGFLWPNLAGGFGGDDRDRHARRHQGRRTRRCRSTRASRPTSPDARAFIMLVDPARQQFVARRGRRPATARRSTSARSTSAARTSAASPTRASGTSGSSARATARATTGSASRPPGTQYGPAPRGMDRFAVKVDGDGVLTLDTGKITLGPLPVALGQPGIIPPQQRPPAASDRRDVDRPPRSPMTDTPGREPEERLPARRDRRPSRRRPSGSRRRRRRARSS